MQNVKAVIFNHLDVRITQKSEYLDLIKSEGFSHFLILYICIGPEGCIGLDGGCQVKKVWIKSWFFVYVDLDDCADLSNDLCLSFFEFSNRSSNWSKDPIISF